MTADLVAFLLAPAPSAVQGVPVLVLLALLTRREVRRTTHPRAEAGPRSRALLVLWPLVVVILCTRLLAIMA